MARPPVRPTSAINGPRCHSAVHALSTAGSLRGGHDGGWRTNEQRTGGADRCGPSEPHSTGGEDVNRAVARWSVHDLATTLPSLVAAVGSCRSLGCGHQSAKCPVVGCMIVIEKHRRLGPHTSHGRISGARRRCCFFASQQAAMKRVVGSGYDGGTAAPSAPKKQKVVVKWVGGGKASKVEAGPPPAAAPLEKKAPAAPREREQKVETKSKRAGAPAGKKARGKGQDRPRGNAPALDAAKGKGAGKVKRKKVRKRDVVAAYNASVMDEYSSGFMEPVPSHGGDLPVEGEFFEGELYLVDKKKGIAYSSSERSSSGEMIRLGAWDEATRAVVLDKPPASDEQNGTERSDSDGDRSDGDTAMADADAEEEQEGGAVAEPSFPFEVTAADHCETRLEAYKDIEWALARLTEVLGYGKDRSRLRIYDPYYCNGAVVRNLAGLGFTNVYNKKEDFYDTVRRFRMPEFDVLVTNPPYSPWEETCPSFEDNSAYEDHCERLLRIATSAGKPFMLLMPNYVYMKAYFNKALEMPPPVGGWGSAAGAKEQRRVAPMLFVTPQTRYSYVTPDGLRPGLSKAELVTSPFVSFWYCSLGRRHHQIIKWSKKNKHLLGNCKISFAAKALPANMKASNDPTRKRVRKKQRDAKKKKAAVEAVS